MRFIPDKLEDHPAVSLAFRRGWLGRAGEDHRQAFYLVTQLANVVSDR